MMDKKLLEDMRDVLKLEQGRRVIWEIMDQAGLMARISDRDLAGSQRLLGRREVALDLHDWVMAASPAAFLKMLEQRAQDLEGDKND